MKRPYMICHILSSLDGKINGSFMGTEAASMLGLEYGKLRTEMHADAWMYGATTTKEFINFRKPVLENISEVPKGDFVVDDNAKLYYISIDIDGEIGWESGSFSNRGRVFFSHYDPNMAGWFVKMVEEWKKQHDSSKEKRNR